MDDLDLTYLKQNTELYQQIQHISKIKNLDIQMSGYKVILEYMNAYCLTQLLHIDTNDFRIINIIDQYSIYNNKLFEIMLAINADYDTWSELGIDEVDIELFLSDIQKVYKIIKTNYGDIIFDKNLDFCQTYFLYIDYLDSQDQCFIELEKLMNYSPNDNWYIYMKTVSAIYPIFDKYNHTYSWKDKKPYIHQILEMIGDYYE